MRLVASHGATGSSLAPRRRRSGEGARRAAAALAATPGAVLGLAARAVLTATALITALIGVAIALRVLGANPHNAVAHAVHSAANLFAGSFTTLFLIAHHPVLALVVDWGIALLLFAIAGVALAALIAALAPSSRAAGERQGS
ncbi:MAG TPA: hypothetical protein VL977_08320 [Solirubrobacteraceae bacterium]|nr:hypothetical protein [Solirubrobacteraceae bacterium]